MTDDSCHKQNFYQLKPCKSCSFYEYGADSWWTLQAAVILFIYFLTVSNKTVYIKHQKLHQDAAVNTAVLQLAVEKASSLHAVLFSVRVVVDQ